MNYWKELGCDNYDEINQQIMSWVEQQPIIGKTKDFWNPVDVKELLRSCPAFSIWLMKHKLHIKSVAVTYGTNVNCCGVHVDTPPARFKLSWPVKNTKGSWNRWFQHTGNCETSTNELGGKIYKDYSNLVKVEMKELLHPCIIDASIPHDVWYPENSNPIFPRIGLQCQLINEPESL